MFFPFLLPSCYAFIFCIYRKKNKLNISEFYKDSITFRTNIMHTSTNFDQTDRTGPLVRYDGVESGEYLNDSDSYNDNNSDCGSDDYNNYESNYASNNEEASCASTSTTEAVKERKVNMTYTLRQENFNDKFSPKDLLNAIRGILSSSPKDMSDDKGSLDCLPIYSFLFSNEKGSSLYNAYDRSEVKDKLVIKLTKMAIMPRNFPLPTTFLKYMVYPEFMNVLTVKNL